MSEALENLSEKASQRISQLVENWGVDREKLLEEFENIYESVTRRNDLDFSSEEERQKFTVEKLSVQVAVEKEGFTSKPGVSTPSPDRGSGAGVDLRLRDSGGSKLSPLSYSTGKDQAGVIEEVLEAFESSDLVFLKGVVGSGKSVIGIRTALEFGGGTVSVPTKVHSLSLLRNLWISSLEKENLSPLLEESPSTLRR